jgi:hypothetical protein
VIFNISVGGWAWGSHPDLVKTLLSRKPGNGKAMVRKWTDAEEEEEEEEEELRFPFQYKMCFNDL